MTNKILPCVIGLGYVGLPVFVRLNKKFQTIGFDTNLRRVNLLKKKRDLNKEINNKNLKLLKKRVPFLGELMLGHVRYGTFGKNSIESVHPFLRQNNWMHRNLIVAGNFNMTNTDELFQSLVKLGQHPREQSDTIPIMERIGHFLDSEVISGYNKLKKKGVLKSEMPPLIEKELNIEKILKKSSKKWDGGYVIAGMIGHGDSFVIRDPHGIRPAYYFENDEVVAVASERPAIQTVFDVSYPKIQEIPRAVSYTHLTLPTICSV